MATSRIDDTVDGVPDHDVSRDDALGDTVDDVVDGTDREVVEKEEARLRDFVKGLTGDDVKSGNWFSKLVAHALGVYTTKVNWEYFEEKYQGVPADAIVQERIKMAARYAALEGGMSAGAYTAAVAATVGSAGGASPLTLPAAGVTVLVDLSFTTQLQLRLAWDIAVLYGIPLDINDPDDLWKLIRVAFTIKGGEAAREGLPKAVPLVVRPLVRKFYSKGVLTAGRSLPVVGKFLLQRNVIKIGIPLVGVPLSVVLNRYTTLAAGRHAQSIFRNEARIIEVATRLVEGSRHPETLLWVAWLLIVVDKISDDETQLMSHLVRLTYKHHGVSDERLRRVVDVEPAEVWERVAAEEGELSDLVDAAAAVASIDGAINKREQAIIDELIRRCRSDDGKSEDSDSP